MGTPARGALAHRVRPELGWINRPNLSLPDFYGAGASLHTNAQRFRGRRDVARTAEAGRIRVICSGDSFALGYGVDDDKTWCHQLTELDPRIEPINMGQGGYGIDQSYLWYRRDGKPLAPRVHLFTFIVEDFARMRATSFFGYGKPKLRLDGETLAVENVPVPRVAYWFPSLARNLGTFQELRSVELIRALATRLGASSGAPASRAAAGDVPRLAAAVFAALAQQHREAGSRLVLVYLPMEEEARDDSTAALRRFVTEEAQRQGVVFLDGVAALRRLPRDEIPELYLHEGATQFRAAEGHYTERGNLWAARWLLESLRDRDLLRP